MQNALKQDIWTLTREVGFDLAGVTSPRIEDTAFFIRWLERGMAGTMAYMAKHLEKRLDPRQLVPEVRSILCVGLNYYQEYSVETTPCVIVRNDRRERRSNPDLPPKVMERDCFGHTNGLAMTQMSDHGQVAMYAWGRDYHEVVKEKLHKLAEEIRALLGRDFIYRVFVDSGPVLEKPLAVQAGLGWVGKNSSLINSQWGSFFVLGELFLDFELPPNEPAKNKCGQCRLCMDACPTGAIVEPGTIDARRCISYLTIEHRDKIEPELAGKMGGRLFGCDRCQRVCPFNRQCPQTHVEEFQKHILGPHLDARDVLSWNETSQETRTAGSAGQRATLDQWHRNAKIMIDNQVREATGR